MGCRIHRNTARISAFWRRSVFSRAPGPLSVHHNVAMPVSWSAIPSALRGLTTSRRHETSMSTTIEEPRKLPTSGFTIINLDQSVEEEELPDYRADRFFPVQLGEVLHERYQIIAKLGFGTSSTTWLARDLQ